MGASSNTPRVFGLAGRAATLASSSLSGLVSSFWTCQGLLALVAAGQDQLATSRDDPADDEHQHQTLACLLALSHIFALVSATSALVGFCGAYTRHFPWIRYYALYSIAESGFAALVLASIGLVAITPPSSQALSQALCSELTRGAHRQQFWTGSLRDGLESCEDRISTAALPLWLAAATLLLLKWQFVDCTLSWYHYIVKRDALFGRSTAYDAIPLSDTSPTSLYNTRAADVSSRRRARTLSSSMYNPKTPKLSLSTSPYYVGSQASSPVAPGTKQSFMSGCNMIQSPIAMSHDHQQQSQASSAAGQPHTRSAQRRNTHTCQPSDAHRQNYLVYAPVALLPLEEAREWASSSPAGSQGADANGAFAFLKGDTASRPLPSRSQSEIKQA